MCGRYCVPPCVCGSSCRGVLGERVVVGWGGVAAGAMGRWGGGRGGVTGTRGVEVVAVWMTVAPRLMNCYAGGGGRRGAGGGDGAGAQRHHDTHRRKSRHTRTRTCAHAQMHTCTCTRAHAHEQRIGVALRFAWAGRLCACVCLSNTCFLTRSRRPTPYVVPPSNNARRATLAVTAARRGYVQPSTCDGAVAPPLSPLAARP